MGLELHHATRHTYMHTIYIGVGMLQTCGRGSLCFLCRHVYYTKRKDEVTSLCNDTLPATPCYSRRSAANAFPGAYSHECMV